MKTITERLNAAETCDDAAALITELLAALEEIIDHATRYGAAPISAVKMFNRARAAIAKAKGEAK